GHGAPGVAGTSKAHGSPLGEELAAEAKRLAGWEHPLFTVPEPVRTACNALAEAGARDHGVWRTALAAFEDQVPQRAAEFRRGLDRRLPSRLADGLSAVPGEAPRATRQSSQACLKALTAVMPELIGGSADLAGSTGTATGGVVVTRDDYAGTTIAFGIR